jgi:hypothetical protein
VGMVRIAAPDGRLQAVVAEAPRHQYGGEVTTMWTLSAAILASTSLQSPWNILINGDSQ